MSDSQLDVKIIDGKLVIEIGTSLLCHAIQFGDYFTQFDELTITDEAQFVKAIRQELLSESEDGTTLVHQLFDKAAENAYENGCEGIEVEDYE
jgi:hypothetical protein